MLNGETDIRFLMSAVNPVTEDNILLSIQYLKDLPPEQAELLDEKSFLTLMKPGIGNDEGEVLEPEIKEALLGGKTYTYLTEMKEIAGVPCTQYYVARKIANEIIILLFTCDPGVSLEDFAADIVF